MKMKYIDLGKTPFKGNIKDVEIEQLSCVRSLLNVTNLKPTILFKNPNSQNKLVKQLHFLERIYQQKRSLCELGQTNFLKKQKKKLDSWLPKNEKSYEAVRFPELSITRLPFERKFQRSLTTVCHANGEHLSAGKSSKKLTKTEHEKCEFDETFLTRMTSCLESDQVIKKQNNLFNQELLSKKPVNDKRFYDLESKLQSYSANNNQVSQCSYVPSVVNFYRQKTGFTMCSQ